MAAMYGKVVRACIYLSGLGWMMPRTINKLSNLAGQCMWDYDVRNATKRSITIIVEDRKRYAP